LLPLAQRRGRHRLPLQAARAGDEDHPARAVARAGAQQPVERAESCRRRHRVERELLVWQGILRRPEQQFVARREVAREAVVQARGGVLPRGDDEQGAVERARQGRDNDRSRLLRDGLHGERLAGLCLPQRRDDRRELLVARDFR
jgi:hypothetical protein